MIPLDHSVNPDFAADLTEEVVPERGLLNGRLRMGPEVGPDPLVVLFQDVEGAGRKKSGVRHIRSPGVAHVRGPGGTVA